MNNNNYISIVYDEKRTPRTDYPNKLAYYLFSRFNMQQNDRLLEIGCGRGEFLEAFKQLGLNCCGVDLCEYRDKESCSLHVKKIDASKDTFPFDDNTFDFVYLSH